MGSAAMDDLRLAHALADLADAVSTEQFSAGPGRGRLKADGTLKSDADLAVERALLDLLARERPRDAVLSEEAGPIGEGSRVWTIDPIDGTASFLARGRLWGTKIALAVDREQAIGIVSNPPLQRRYWATRGLGARRAALQTAGSARQFGSPSRANYPVSDRRLRHRRSTPASASG